MGEKRMKEKKKKKRKKKKEKEKKWTFDEKILPPPHLENMTW